MDGSSCSWTCGFWLQVLCFVFKVGLVSVDAHVNVVKSIEGRNVLLPFQHHFRCSRSVHLCHLPVVNGSAVANQDDCWTTNCELLAVCRSKSYFEIAEKHKRNLKLVSIGNELWSYQLILVGVRDAGIFQLCYKHVAPEVAMLVINKVPSRPYMNSWDYQVLGVDYTMTCVTKSWSVPANHGLRMSYQWYLGNSRQMLSNLTAGIELKGRNLVIRRLSERHDGHTYKCRVREEGTFWTDYSPVHTIQVRYGPKDISLTITESDDDWITLNCDADCRPPCSLQFYNDNEGTIHDDSSHGNITNEDSSHGNITNVDSSHGNISNEDSSHGNITNVDSSHGNITNEDSSHGNISNEDSSHGNISNEDSSHGNISNEDISHGNISTKDSSHGNISNKDSSHGNISNEDSSHGNITNEDSYHGDTINEHNTHPDTAVVTPSQKILLILRQTERNPGDTYTCVVKNIHARASKSIVFKQNLFGARVSTLTSSQNITNGIRENSTLKLACLMTSRPEPEATWHYYSINNQSYYLLKSSYYSPAYTANIRTDIPYWYNSTVSLDRTECGDTGRYCCRVRNSVGHDESCVRIYVKCAPWVLDSQKSLKVNMAASLSHAIPVYSYSPLYVDCRNYIPENLLGPCGLDVNVTSHPEVPHLYHVTIHKDAIGRDDIGRYIIGLENCFGRRESSIDILEASDRMADGDRSLWYRLKDPKVVSLLFVSVFILLVGVIVSVTTRRKQLDAKDVDLDIDATTSFV